MEIITHKFKSKLPHIKRILKITTYRNVNNYFYLSNKYTLTCISALQNFQVFPKEELQNLWSS